MKNADRKTLNCYCPSGGKRNTKILPSHSLLSKDAWCDVHRELRGDMEALTFRRLGKATQTNLVFNSSSSICILAINLNSGIIPFLGCRGLEGGASGAELNKLGWRQKQTAACRGEFGGTTLLRGDRGKARWALLSEEAGSAIENGVFALQRAELSFSSCWSWQNFTGCSIYVTGCRERSRRENRDLGLFLGYRDTWGHEGKHLKTGDWGYHRELGDLFWMVSSAIVFMPVSNTTWRTSHAFAPPQAWGEDIFSCVHWFRLPLIYHVSLAFPFLKVDTELLNSPYLNLAQRSLGDSSKNSVSKKRRHNYSGRSRVAIQECPLKRKRNYKKIN